MDLHIAGKKAIICASSKGLGKACALSLSREGVIVYMNQEGRGIGLLNKLKAYKLQEQGMDKPRRRLRDISSLQHRIHKQYKDQIN